MHNLFSNDKGVATVEVEVSRFAVRSLVLETRVLGLGAIIKIVTILATFINKEANKTEASFLAFETTDT